MLIITRWVTLKDQWWQEDNSPSRWTIILTKKVRKLLFYYQLFVNDDVPGTEAAGDDTLAAEKVDNDEPVEDVVVDAADTAGAQTSEQEAASVAN